MLIGLSGYARSGKDTVGGFLVEWGFRRAAFADALKEAALEVDPQVHVFRAEDTDLLGGTVLAGMIFGHLAEIVETIGWEKAKQIAAVRESLQNLGVAMRHVDPDIWVTPVRRLWESHENVVVTDVRFPNEAQAIQDAGGEVWRILRSDVEAVNGHESETALDDFKFDQYVRNFQNLYYLRCEAYNAWQLFRALQYHQANQPFAATLARRAAEQAE